MRLSKAFIAVLAVAGTAQAAELTLFKQPNFTGQALTLRGENDDLSAASFQDQVSSIVVRSGRWQVCTQPNFQGDCEVLGPGRYASLEQKLNHRIESARHLAGYARDERGHRYADEGNWRDRGYNGYDNRDDARDDRDRRGWDERYNAPQEPRYDDSRDGEGYRYGRSGSASP
jgi:hypothetical protein